MAINLLKIRIWIPVAHAYGPSPQARDSPSMHLVSPVLQTKSMASRDGFLGFKFCFATYYLAVGSGSCHLIISQFSQFSTGDEITQRK